MRWPFLAFPILLLGIPANAAEHTALPPAVKSLVETRCVGCHGADEPKGRLNLEALKYEPNEANNLERWVKVLDRVTAGEMPPRKKLDATDHRTFTQELSKSILESEQARIGAEGRSATRRLNRREYENVLRDLFQLPWLEIEEALPEDGIAQRINKSAEALNVSHIQVGRYLAAAEIALKRAMAPAAERPITKTTRYYAREQTTFTGKMFFSAFNMSPEQIGRVPLRP